jgi:hypothetical protein
MFLQLHHVLNSMRVSFQRSGQRVGQRVGCLAIEVVKLLVKLLMKLYQTGPTCYNNCFVCSTLCSNSYT